MREDKMVSMLVCDAIATWLTFQFVVIDFDLLALSLALGEACG